MKNFYTLLLFMFCLQFGFGQIGFEENIVIDQTHLPLGLTSVFSSDIDGDGDMDILSSSADDKIAWFENIGGIEGFGSLQIISTTANGASSVYSADLDNDGDMDVLSSSSYDHKIAWYENTDGQGTFGPQQIITTNTESAKSVFAADLDQDGDMDVLSLSETIYGDKIAWYENVNGQGIFGPQQNITNYADTSNFSVIDIDSDGDMDIVTSSYADGEIILHENIDGQGNFSNQQIIISSVNQVSGTYPVDMDGDNDIDILQLGNTLAWYENIDGQGSFNQEALEISDNTYQHLITKDIDNDGDLDIVVSKSGNGNSYDDDRILWYENLGQGSFGSENIISTTALNTRSLSVTDIDADGDLDVISASQTQDSKIAWYENTDGQGTFGFQKIITKSSVDTKSLYTTDIDGDGDIDVLSASSFVQYSDGKISWYENTNGQGNFVQKIITANDVVNASGVHAADINGDSKIDVVSSSESKLAWYENIDGQGNFGLQQIIATDNLGLTPEILTVDLDIDGDIDIISIRNSYVVWYENIDGLGAFSSYQNIGSSLYNPNNVEISDIDGDGDLDVIASAIGDYWSENDDMIVWFENIDGQGNFGSEQIITASAISTSNLHFSDIDSDGDMDLITSEARKLNLSIDGKVAWYENTDGQGTFGLKQIILTDNTVNPVKAYAKDVDGDGDMDVISVSRYIFSPSNGNSEDKVFWFENIDGMGSFGNEQLISTDLNSIVSLAINDINNDGVLDILSASGDGNKIVWFKNLGIQLNEINGNLNLDINSDDCISSDVSVPNLLIESAAGNNSLSTFSLENGFYQLFPNEGTYTTSIVGQLPFYYTSNPSSQTSNFTDVGNTDTVNFCIEPAGVFNDLNISIYPSLNDPRPGFDTTYQLVYNNIGTTPLNGTVAFEFDDSKMQFLTASETISNQTANTLTFDFMDLNPFETRTIDLVFNVFQPPTTNIDDILVSTATVNPVSGDETEDDNVFTLEQTVIGSYDPNDITVLEGDEIFIEDADKYLHYLIRFQNTGTASAINVRVEHILDNKLDWTTMKLESLSHEGRIEIVDGSDVSFIFNNINLPDSTNDEPNSHGFIAFKIKPKSDVQVGDVVSGVADIFFDFNPPITTNMVNTEIVAPLSINEHNFQNVKLFPNPAKDQLEITSPQIIDRLTVIDMNGRLLKDIKLSNSDYILDVSSLLNGIYFLEIKSGETKSVKKFIKN